MGNSKDHGQKETNNQSGGRSGGKSKILTGPVSGGGDKGNKGKGGGVYRPTKSPY